MPQNYNMIPGNISMGANTIIKRKPDDTGWYAPVLNKELIGLGEVDNTSDADKPVSDATLAALDEKADIDSLSLVATTGDYDDLENKPTIPTAKRVETFLGNTDSSGNYTVTYDTPFDVVPDVQPQIQAGTPSQVARITSSTTTGFTVQVTQRNTVSLLGVEVLLGTTVVVNNSLVSVLVTER